MKKLNVIVAFLFVAVLALPSCKKMDKNPDESGISKRMDEMTVDPTFNWGTSRVVEFSLTTATRGVVYINQTESQDWFHKGLISSGEVYVVSVTIPSNVNEVKLSLNGTVAVVPITGNKVSYQFN
ncbi:MAG: hypothetical protein JXA23_06945 [Bacteroidales bacterium]|nr:hypothetical protein [Bacteroidales bacterium]